MPRRSNESQAYLLTARTRNVILSAVFLAAVFNGILAGTNMNALLVHVPAWQHVGASLWAAYSQQADLKIGLIPFLIEGVGGVILSIIAAVLGYLNRRVVPRSTAIPMYAAALFVVGALLAVRQAAPFLLGVPQLSDPLEVQQAMNEVLFWNGVRGIFLFLALCANLWSLISVSRQEAITVGESVSDPSEARMTHTRSMEG